jgi:hypothetical protein
MPTTLQTAISKKTAEGVVEGVQLAAPVAREQVKNETRTLPHSKAARRSGLITGGFVFALLYGVMARRRRLERIEEKLDAVIDEVADDREGAS